MSRVIDIMTKDVLTLGLDDTLCDVRKLMSENRIRHIPIVDEDKNLLGLVSQRDVLAVEESSIIHINPEQRLEREQRVLVRDFYRSEILTITRHASLHNAALYIQKHKIGCLPVVEEEKLIGVITDSDFVNVAINLMEIIAESEPMEQ